ncbi:MAG TPA: CPBP family intramembrane glutamic endopeptidase [Longimicrobiaceae bacterium]|nr:CPBP family intramembrane glutamic endopeptidase [Longimicrobiaceae bacterium]
MTGAGPEAGKDGDPSFPAAASAGDPQGTPAPPRGHRPWSAEWVLFGPYGLRAGWRIALYLPLALGLWATLATLARTAGVPQTFTTQTAVMLAAALLAGWAMLAWVDRRSPQALGLAADRAAAQDSAVGFGLGAGSLALAVGLLVVAGSARWVADDGSVAEYVAVLAQALGFFAVAAAMEEAVFRGYMFQALVQGIGPWPTALLTSALFAAAHLGNPNVGPIALANIGVAGVMLAVAYLRTRSLWFATALHLGWNWAMSALFDFPVSGLVRDTPLYDAVESGADWWSGGPFGPEGGLAATVAVLALTAWLRRTRALGESARMRALRPLVDDRLGERWS